MKIIKSITDRNCDHKKRVFVHHNRLGDLWLTMCKLVLDKTDVVVQCTKECRERVEYCNRMFGNRFNVEVVPDNHESYDEQIGSARGFIRRIKNKLPKPKTFWSEEQRIKGKVCYSKQAVTKNRSKKVDNIDHLEVMLSQYFCQIVCVDYPMSLDDATEHLSDCDLFITNESGLSHIANSMRVPTVVLVGAKNERITRRWQPNKHMICNTLSQLEEYLKNYGS